MRVPFMVTRASSNLGIMQYERAKEQSSFALFFDCLFIEYLKNRQMKILFKLPNLFAALRIRFWTIANPVILRNWGG